MAEKFIGAQVRAGQFQAKDTGRMIDYNNLVLFTTSAAGTCGEVCNDPVKIANTGENIAKVFGRSITMDWLKAQLGKYIDVFYNQYKKVERVIFYDVDPNSDNYAGAITAPTASAGLPVEVQDNGGLKEAAPEKQTVSDLPNEHKETTTGIPQNDKAFNNGGKKS